LILDHTIQEITGFININSHNLNYNSDTQFIIPAFQATQAHYHSNNMDMDDPLVTFLRHQLAAREQDLRDLRRQHRRELREVRHQLERDRQERQVEREHRDREREQEREQRDREREQRDREREQEREQREQEREQRDREREQRDREREQDAQRGERLERLIVGMRNDLYGMQGDFRQTNNMLRACAGQAAQLSSVLTETHRRAIVDTLKPDIQPTIVLMDVSKCPSQRRIYDPDNRYPSVIKLIEGQEGRHVKKTVDTLTKEGGSVLGQVEYQPNGIPFRHHVKRAIEQRLDGVSTLSLISR